MLSAHSAVRVKQKSGTVLYPLNCPSNRCQFVCASVQSKTSQGAICSYDLPIGYQRLTTLKRAGWFRLEGVLTEHPKVVFCSARMALQNCHLWFGQLKSSDGLQYLVIMPLVTLLRRLIACATTATLKFSCIFDLRVGSWRPVPYDLHPPQQEHVGQVFL